MKHGTPDDRFVRRLGPHGVSRRLREQVLLSPKGEVGVAERDLMLFATGLMLS